MNVRANATLPVGPMTQVLDRVLSEGDFDGTLDLVCLPVRGRHAFCVRFTRARRAFLRNAVEIALAWFLLKNLD